MSVKKYKIYFEKMIYKCRPDFWTAFAEFK